MNAVTIHKDHFDVLLDCNDTEIGLLIRALIADSADQLPKDLKIIYKYIDAQNKRFVEQQEAYSKMQAERGKKGGAPVGNQNAKKQPKSTENKQNKPTVSVSETVPNTETNSKAKDTPPTPSRGKKAHIADFAAFWKAYPRKKSKGQAEKAWNSLKPDNELLATMLDKLAIAKTCRDWVKDEGEYIPYPATWLNAKGWEDEYDKAKTPYSEEDTL